MVSDRSEISLLRQRVAELESLVRELSQSKDDQAEVIRKLQVRLYLNGISHKLDEASPA